MRYARTVRQRPQFGESLAPSEWPERHMLWMLVKRSVAQPETRFVGPFMITSALVHPLRPMDMNILAWRPEMLAFYNFSSSYHKLAGNTAWIDQLFVARAATPARCRGTKNRRAT